jgi:hypothetical protein
MRNIEIFKINLNQICRVLLTLLFLFVYHSGAFSQNSDDSTRVRIRPGFFTGFNSTISKSQIITEGTGSVADMKPVPGNSFSGTIETGYFFSGSFGFTTGVGINSFSSGSSLDNYSNKFTATDSENEPYERRITGSAIKEDQNITFLNIPLLLNLRIPGRSIFGIYIDCGINFSVPLTSEYISEGTFSFTGYYPSYNVLLENLPEYGFQNNATVSASGHLELNSYVIEGIASAGFQFLIANNFQLSLGATYARSLSSFSVYTGQDKFQLSPDVESINSMLGSSYNSVAESMGIRVSLRYFFKKTGYRGIF